MRHFIIISCLIFISGLLKAGQPDPIVEYEVEKTNGGIGALFNLYDKIQSEKNETSGGYEFFLTCMDPGWNRCVMYNEVAPPNDIPQAHWEEIQETMQELDQLSEQEARDGNNTGTSSEVLAMELYNGSYVYYVCNVEWIYSEENTTTGEVYLATYKYDEYPPR